ncbi:2Fe-2S iron-sulfur cluster-binding protein [Celeribacter baekdonensis]|uniref:Ferredoxin n=1 Tax=Celeribacter baekdonensis TaxID=875171 RepID=A0A2R4M5F0_9RHOB|nr:2Fe-2S iron-sulfur cluster-binding protein [Celeribacter baekdonensis]AVW92366.1 ferredoxin [Celeribacter baekdonensis]
MALIHVKDRDGHIHHLDASSGLSIMEIIRDAGLAIEAQCGGAASCATCHVYVEETWLSHLKAQSDTEVDMLDLTDGLRDNSRLSCQIPFNDELDGLTVELAPE